jgi:hypothetical protein
MKTGNPVCSAGFTTLFMPGFEFFLFSADFFTVSSENFLENQA